MTSPIPTHPRNRPTLTTRPSSAYSQKDIYHAIMASTTQNPKSLDGSDSQNYQSASAFEYPPPPPPSPVESRNPHAF
ncbi:hypothetical protein P175DRAFT_0502299 [Aspergillus ochraceoroseus IBT 24754]|uniref:Uncharacterized protein n=1 Tax=Aspergillus ochraceoroseus IBT 24754 TaxID=1392256 RepID=A0A2T5LV36_9EURO|nr:uncharacterized protein P175DRAFT_0502299 [Aspergillus ochraceoroseus IBT 24754]PTU20148.1 hypothetical protein P175DRAFT_0502299 [Aspergillus ochraceoroseus IBT 24754]